MTKKQPGRRKGLISVYILYSLSSREDRARAQGWTLVAGTEAEAVEKPCLLACFPWIAQLAYTDQDHLPKGGAIHSRLGTFTSIMN